VATLRCLRRFLFFFFSASFDAGCCPNESKIDFELLPAKGLKTYLPLKPIIQHTSTVLSGELQGSAVTVAIECGEKSDVCVL